MKQMHYGVLFFVVSICITSQVLVSAVRRLDDDCVMKKTKVSDVPATKIDKQAYLNLVCKIDKQYCKDRYQYQDLKKIFDTLEIQMDKTEIEQMYQQFDVVVNRQPLNDTLVIGCGNVPAYRNDIFVCCVDDYNNPYAADDTFDCSLLKTFSIDYRHKHGHVNCDTIDVDFARNPTIVGCFGEGKVNFVPVFKGHKYKRIVLEDISATVLKAPLTRIMLLNLLADDGVVYMGSFENNKCGIGFKVTKKQLERCSDRFLYELYYDQENEFKILENRAGFFIENIEKLYALLNMTSIQHYLESCSANFDDVCTWLGCSTIDLQIRVKKDQSGFLDETLSMGFFVYHYQPGATICASVSSDDYRKMARYIALSNGYLAKFTTMNLSSMGNLLKTIVITTTPQEMSSYFSRCGVIVNRKPCHDTLFVDEYDSSVNYSNDYDTICPNLAKNPTIVGVLDSDNIGYVFNGHTYKKIILKHKDLTRLFARFTIAQIKTLLLSLLANDGFICWGPIDSSSNPQTWRLTKKQLQAATEQALINLRSL